MGEREDPARLVFTSKTGPAIATSLVDLGRPLPSDHQRCGLQKDRKTNAKTSGLQLHSGHRSRISKLAPRPGFWQEVHIILPSPMI